MIKYSKKQMPINFLELEDPRVHSGVEIQQEISCTPN